MFIEELGQEISEDALRVFLAMRRYGHPAFQPDRLPSYVYELFDSDSPREEVETAYKELIDIGLIRSKKGFLGTIYHQDRSVAELIFKAHATRYAEEHKA